VEILDHQVSLSEQNIPEDAIFVMKKTGIMDELSLLEDPFDNHFLYVQVNQLSFLSHF
jgi:hypothetical protein